VVVLKRLASSFKFISRQTISDGVCESDEIDLEIAHQLRRIADSLERREL
jgi:hypothetical protein